MFGPSRGHAPTRNTTRKRSPKRCANPGSITSILLRSAACADVKRDVPANVNAFWQNQRFHNYADYAMSEEFHSGLIKLRELGHATQCAIMCAEAVWWRCHRRIIADYLIAAGETVFHILGRKHLEQARMTGAAKIGPAGTLTYSVDV
jgi:uncharacterized protein (DUF488 family)